MKSVICDGGERKEDCGLGSLERAREFTVDSLQFAVSEKRNSRTEPGMGVRREEAASGFSWH